VEERRQRYRAPIDHLKNRSAGRARAFAHTPGVVRSPLTATYRAPTDQFGTQGAGSHVNLSEQIEFIGFSANRAFACS